MDTIRLSKLKKLLKENNLDAVVVSSLPNIIHLTNFSYFTDIEREGFLLITKTNQYIFTDGRYTHAVKKQVENFELRELKASASLINHLKQIFEEEHITIVGIEEDNMTVKELKQLQTVINNQKHFTLHTIRLQKTSKEITAIQNACEIGDKAFSYILKQINVDPKGIFDITEKELAFLLETFIRQLGYEPSFSSIVAFGENAAVPHHKTGNRKLKMNEYILLDFGVQYKNYCSDMTRTIFAGIANKEQKETYQTVKEAQQKAIDYIEKQLQNKQQVKASDADKTARDYILKKGFPSFPHSLGHGIGLQVHEAPSISPKSKDSLTEGMVFSIEPGIYLPDQLGIRIEDLFAVQNGKLVQLTKAPRDLIELKI